uniref:Zinc/iron-chelating domain-containing protein n=1 Tax=Chromera velia CCMP2878 TaxID=1169474 RepID=A0A0G4G9R0_9ALVE|eukprot:Cvel_20840.t1-p1 / transcript=Cvel_20840.t1 / gene=Cvel_20840 / organism=Chromera_velia_CCMP2878 / gene_product=Uncharacterized protein jhp_0259, putative / transcript_product=Uncharacterized protein jhp_0259, putative / location=Cvel_scaffold1907:19627-20724(-) / protein_length=366 / sequence_SO=supercontig / SO=protein_coding / is_pseudo=false
MAQLFSFPTLYNVLCFCAQRLSASGNLEGEVSSQSGVQTEVEEGEGQWPPTTARRRQTTETTWISSEPGGLKFGCTGCGKCCRTKGYVVMSPSEIRGASEFLSITPDTFKEKFCSEVLDNGWAYLIDVPDEDFEPGRLTSRCVFLTPGTEQCQIYEHRPFQCRTYPLWPSLAGSRSRWENEAVEDDDSPEGPWWDYERGGCEGISLGEGRMKLGGMGGKDMSAKENKTAKEGSRKRREVRQEFLMRKVESLVREGGGTEGKEVSGHHKSSKKFLSIRGEDLGGEEENSASGSGLQPNAEGHTTEREEGRSAPVHANSNSDSSFDALKSMTDSIPGASGEGIPPREYSEEEMVDLWERYKAYWRRFH